MKKPSPLFTRLFFYAGVLMFCGLVFQAGGKEETPQPAPQWTNSLGMKFVPVPGTNVLFSIWDTRVQDHQAFVAATGREWQKPDFEQGPTHPAVMVSWDDAKAFCAWLTEKERSTGMLKPTQEYRLPTDLEWSAAVGLGKETGSTPAERSERIKDVYPWGTQWPPPHGAGNFNSNNNDNFERTSPVGSFAANQFGLYDMSGNISQWVEDFFNGQGEHVLRGSSWGFGLKGSDGNHFLLSSRRSRSPRSDNNRMGEIGFRCVLTTGGETAPQEAAQPSSVSTPIAPPATANANATATPAPTPAPSLPTSSSIQVDASQTLTKILSLQAPNATAWALAPLDQTVPGDIRQNLTYLREDLLDEGKAAPKASADAYKLGSLLCDNLIAALDERTQTLAEAGYRSAQADANTRVTSQSLEARRNYMMSWPQYARERDERGEIQRQQTNNTVLVKESVKTQWSKRAAVLRKSLDALYAKYRDALRQGNK